ncbi:hypothetical protein ACFQ3Z_28640 [Streptomyces nogalater]
MSPRAGQAGHPARTLAFVESPVQLLNVLEWAHLHAGRPRPARRNRRRSAASERHRPTGPRRR